MLLDKLKHIWTTVDKLNTHVKTFLIVLFMGIGICLFTDQRVEQIIYGQEQKVKYDKKLAESYTETITPMIGDYLQGILDKDPEATHVLLLNYHNTLVSSEGLSYRYLTLIAEKRRGINTKSCGRFWKELEYTQYGEEIQRINSAGFLHIDSLEYYQYAFPNFSDLLRYSGAHSAAFYPIRGVNGPLGMLIVMYPTKKVYQIGYYATVVARATQPLSSLLDYYNMKELFQSTNREQFPSNFRKLYDNRQN